jgi:hypothetical protein
MQIYANIIIYRHLIFLWVSEGFSHFFLQASKGLFSCVLFCRISSGRATTRPGLSGASWRSPVRRQRVTTTSDDVTSDDTSARLLHGLTALRGAVAHLHPVVVAPNPDLTWPFSKFWTVWLVWLWNTLDMSYWSFIHVFISIQFTWSVEVSCQIKSSNQTSSLLQSTQSFISRASLTFPRSRVVPASSHSNNIVLNSSYRDAATIQNQCSDCAVTGDRLLVATGLMKDFLRNCSIFCTGLRGFLCNMSHSAPLNLRGVLTCLNQFWITFKSISRSFPHFSPSASLHPRTRIIDQKLDVWGPTSQSLALPNWPWSLAPQVSTSPGAVHETFFHHLLQKTSFTFILFHVPQKIIHKVLHLWSWQIAMAASSSKQT